MHKAKGRLLLTLFCFKMTLQGHMESAGIKFALREKMCYIVSGAYMLLLLNHYGLNSDHHACFSLPASRPRENGNTLIYSYYITHTIYLY